MEGWERVKWIMDENGHNKNSFSEAIGLSSNVTITRLINEKRKPSLMTCQKIVEAFPEYNFNWLFSGEGEIKTGVSKNANSKGKLASEAAFRTNFEIQHVPLVNQYAYAGYLDGYCDVTYLEELPHIPFIVDREGRGMYLAFEIRGDSMDDGTDEGYKEGETVLCREIGQHLWTYSKLHLKKWDFIIVHEDGILLKRIIDHDVDNHTITIHSLNDFYPDKILDLKEVKQIFNVVQSTKSRRR